MKFFEVIRKSQVTEIIQVQADNKDQARQIAEDDFDENIKVIQEDSGVDWEVSNIREISEIPEED